MKGDDISQRFIELAVRVIRLAKALPKDFVGKHIGNQLLSQLLLLRKKLKNETFFIFDL